MNIVKFLKEIVWVLLIGESLITILDKLNCSVIIPNILAILILILTDIEYETSHKKDDK